MYIMQVNTCIQLVRGKELAVKTILIFSGLIFLLALVATATGIFYQTPGSPFEYTTVRGERVVYQGSGLYRYDPAWFAREGIVWDVVNLSIGLPLFALAIFLTYRGSTRGRLLLCAMLFYFFYVYLMAATGNSMNLLFLVYVAIFALSAVTFFLTLNTIDVAHLPAAASSHFPRRLFIGYTLLVGCVLVVLWTGRVVPILLSGRFPPDTAGLTTLQSQAIDLGLVVPLMLATGILLWRRSMWGYLLAGISLGYGVMMSISLPAWIAIPLIQDGKVNLLEASPLLLICLAGPLLAALYYANLPGEKLPGSASAAYAGSLQQKA
jgi:hypothetical protein